MKNPHVIWVTDAVAVSSALTLADLEGLAGEGVRSIIDLRADAEPRPQGLPPWEEATVAAAHGLVYEQLAVEPPRLSDAVGRLVLRALRAAPSPVLMHCTTGRRAGTFGLIALACEQPRSIGECLRRGRAMGLDFDGMPRLTEFLVQYVMRHGCFYQPGSLGDA
jgi:uncharacterized protein (TIGR01244 family)